jgi:hypothetical protein
VAERRKDRLNKEKKSWRSNSLANLKLFSRFDVAGYVINYS